MKICPRPHQNSSSTAGNGDQSHHHPSPSPSHSQPKIMNRSESGTNPYPTTFVQADTSCFKQVVQMLTGSPESAKDPPSKTHIHIPPIKSIPKRQQQQQQSSFKLYERRTRNQALHTLHINPGFSPRNRNFPEILSPTMLDFPSLVLSPVTPLIPDPFHPSQPFNSESESSNNNNSNNNNNVNHPPALDEEAEAKAIREKGFYLHPSPSPATTPRESHPQLLPLFPITSPPHPGSSSSTSSFQC